MNGLARSKFGMSVIFALFFIGLVLFATIVIFGAEYLVAEYLVDRSCSGCEPPDWAKTENDIRTTFTSLLIAVGGATTTVQRVGTRSGGTGGVVTTAHGSASTGAKAESW